MELTPQSKDAKPDIAALSQKVAILEAEIRKIKRESPGFIKISFLPHRHLQVPLDAVLEPDGTGFIARTTEIPLYGHGNNPEEAVEMLKREIESLYEDLMEDDAFSEEWLTIKRFLMERKEIDFPQNL